MATRSAIAIRRGAGFTGRYHHWDGYPSGLGRALWGLYRGHFGSDLAAMRRALLDEHPAGWSTIVGADFSLPAGFRDSREDLCGLCGQDEWRHYRQYYDHQNGKGDVGRPLPDPALADPANPILVLGHGSAPRTDLLVAPQCYCHGSRSEDEQAVTERTAGAIGCEYVYLLEPDALYVLTAIDRDGDKMIGMFGAGDAESTWRTAAILPWGGSETNWEKVDRLAGLGLGVA